LIKINLLIEIVCAVSLKKMIEECLAKRAVMAF